MKQLKRLLSKLGGCFVDNLNLKKLNAIDLTSQILGPFSEDPHYGFITYES